MPRAICPRLFFSCFDMISLSIMHNTILPKIERRKQHIGIRVRLRHKMMFGIHCLHNYVYIIICDNAQCLKKCCKGIEKNRKMVYYIISVSSVSVSRVYFPGNIIAYPYILLHLHSACVIQCERSEYHLTNMPVLYIRGGK